MKKLVVVFVLIAAALSAQPQKVLYYSGADLTYICESKNQTSGTTTTWARSDSTLTSIVVATNVATVTTSTAHQLYDGARITIVGSTAAALDGNFTVLSTPSSTTFTVGITAADATHTEAGMSMSTKSPLLNSKYWRIQVLYNESSILQSMRWEDYNGFGVRCSDRALYK